MSSPTSWTLEPATSVSVRHESQSSSARPSSIGDDGVALDEAGDVLDHSVARLLAALEAVVPVRVQLRRRRVERDRDALAVARALGGLEHGVDRLLARAEVGREAALVADRGREPALVQQRARACGRPRRRSRSASENVSAPAGTSMNSCRSIEFCAWAPPLITFIIGTGSVAAPFAAEVPVERDAGIGRSRLRRRRARRRGSRSRRAGPCSACRRARSSARRPRAGRSRRGPARPRRARRSRSPTARVTPLPPHSLPPSRSSSASCTPVDAPDGTAARPNAPDSSAHVHLDRRVPARVEDLPSVHRLRWRSCAAASLARSK